MKADAGASPIFEPMLDGGRDSEVPSSFLRESVVNDTPFHVDSRGVVRLKISVHLVLTVRLKICILILA